MPVRHPPLGFFVKFQYEAVYATPRVPRLVTDLFIIDALFLMQALAVLATWFGISILCLLLLTHCRSHPVGSCRGFVSKAHAGIRSHSFTPLTAPRTMRRFCASPEPADLSRSVQAGTPRIVDFCLRLLSPLGLSTPSPPPRVSPATTLSSGDDLATNVTLSETASVSGEPCLAVVPCTPPSADSPAELDPSLSVTRARVVQPPSSTLIPTARLPSQALTDDCLQSQAIIPPSIDISPSGRDRSRPTSIPPHCPTDETAQDVDHLDPPSDQLPAVKPLPLDDLTPGRGRVPTFLQIADAPAPLKPVDKGNGKVKTAPASDSGRVASSSGLPVEEKTPRGKGKQKQSTRQSSRRGRVAPLPLASESQDKNIGNTVLWMRKNKKGNPRVGREGEHARQESGLKA
ncbi:uncharacterized protein PHACADRAFT_24880 [Phanerochaete carnosa HHB-10118-sp]|uniref:Uncharacterized protein n=1 Tax=Phanerochaete carnosa (strain HHB-10118-sp) TaxID=650164 RepID=K5XF35_PHACS|nr:uncharacterized protein PHACADRAFT_24880 [Phanerochaete carnosa HHB-10118-sp]EKM61702.1 hypothetical protein PHACADRAFT_24880 [Phanerochaete carnosa HHB-10118-sp]